MDKSAMPRVLLLVPPGPTIYIRDNYCSYSSKADYYWPPIDLVVQSGLLRDRASVSVLDATAERLDSQTALDRAAALDPQLTLFVTGTASLDADMAFVSELKRRTGTRLFGSGGNLTFWGEEILAQFADIDGVLTEFISDSFGRLACGESQELESLLVREANVLRHYPSRKKKNFHCGLPMHLAFPLSRYKVPQARRHPFVRTLTSFGCSYQCDFCIEGQFALVYRDPDELFEELRQVSSAGIPEIYFMDNVLTAWRERFLLLCRELQKLGGFTWFGQSRADNLDEEMVVEARRAGCHFVMIGVESGSADLLKSHRKGHGVEETLKAFSLLRKHGIETLAYFLVGLPGETRESLEATLDLALRLPCDYATFSIVTPDPGTPLREAAIRGGELDPTQTRFDCSRGSPIRLGTFTHEQLIDFQKRATRRFYLRPAYLARRLANVRGAGDLASKCRTAWSLLFAR